MVNPFLVRSLDLQFYAGHALRTPDGHSIGTLCVIDRRARVFSVQEQTLLVSLAAVVMQLLELRAALAQDSLLAPTLWAAIYTRITPSLTPSLTRIGTLSDLGSWEETPDTPAAVAYRTSLYEEATLIVHSLRQEMSLALARLAQGSSPDPTAVVR